jgi:hypothetical protein
MKLFTGWAVSAGLVIAATTANAQMLTPNENGRPAPPIDQVSDVGGPYAAVPPEAPVPLPPAQRGGPMLLPPTEVYTVVRESGFSPLGIPQRRGRVYTIAVIDRGGDDGHLIIDARNGRILHFVPSYGAGDHFNEDLTVTYGPVGSMPPVSPPTRARGVPRPPASVPHVASRTVPVSKPGPRTAGPAPAQQSAAVQPPQPKPADAQAAVPPAAAPPVVQAKPSEPAATTIQPTQEMPKVQGLE